MSAWVCRSVASALLLLTSATAPAHSLPTPSPGGSAGAAAGDTTGGELVADPGLDGLPIRGIEIRPRTIYDPIPPGRFGPLYRAANRLHVRTRAGTVRQHVVLAPGDPWSPARARETLRDIRGQSYIEPIRMTAVDAGDSVDVTIETRDIWSTIPEFNLESGGGLSYGSVGFTERNLLGLGKSVSTAYRSDPTGISRTASWTDPAVLGSHARFQFGVGKGSAGVVNEFYLGLPFWAEGAPVTAFATGKRSTSVGRLFQGGVTSAEFDERLEEFEVGWGHGAREDGTVRRVIYSFSLRNRRLGASRLGPGAPPDFDGPEENLRIRRLAVDLRVWHPNFIERRGVDRMAGIEDFDLGPQVGVKLGYSPHGLGGTADEAYARFLFDVGADTPLGFGYAHTSIETRFRLSAEELIRQVDARWVHQGLPHQTLVGSAWGVWGSRVARDWQVVVGGLNGLRAYPVHALAGHRAWRFNLEDRWLIGREYGQLANLGAAAFWDGARMWGPGAAGTGWRNGIGCGLRIALPHVASAQVIRLDVAWPVGPTDGGGHDAVFSFGSRQAF